MDKPKSKRWIFAVLLAILFPAFAFHASCVAVLGPGNWGSGMEEKVPEILDPASHPDASRYVTEFAATLPAPGEAAAPPGAPIPGRVVDSDYDVDNGLWIVQSYEGERWIDQQHFTLWSDSTGELDEIEIPPSLIFEQPRFIRRREKALVVLERWNSWYVPASEKLRRYARSWFDETLRPERSLYEYDVQTRELTYFGPGHTLVVAPDRKHGAFLRSGATSSGFYSLHIWDFDTDDVHNVLSLHESDPGSGRSFEYRWSGDSKALHFSGPSAGFARRNPQALELNHFHILGVPGVFEIK